MIDGLVQEEDLKFANYFMSNIRGPKYIKQTSTHQKGDINSNTRGAGDLNTLYISMNTSCR